MHETRNVVLFQCGLTGLLMYVALVEQASEQASAAMQLHSVTVRKATGCGPIPILCFSPTTHQQGSVCLCSYYTA